MTHFGELLKEARIRARLTQQELAKKVPIHHSYISKMENEDFLPSREKAIKLAEALGISDPEERKDFLIAAGVFNEEDFEGYALVKVAAGQTGGQKKGSQPSSSRTSFRSSVVPTDHDILMHRFVALEERIEAVEKNLHDIYRTAEKNLRDVHEELLELKALLAEMLKRQKF